jgi:arylsulfatase A
MRNAAFASFVLALASADQGRPAAPNVLLIIADDMGWGDLRSHGNGKVDTPVLDRLASEGARFDRFFVSPVCAPTRASLLTGRYSLRTGVHGVTRGWETLRAEEVTVAEILRGAGYATGCFGKWHNGAHWPNHPRAQGFAEFLGFCGGHWNNYFDTTLERDGEAVRTKGYITDVLTEEALAFIEKNRERPFFCYVPYNAPHSPFQAPDRLFEKYRALGLDERTACVYAMVENLDGNVGRLLAKLDGLGLSKGTIVLFLTDNGPNTDRYNGGMKGRKGSVNEGGIRVPLFVRWPGRVRAGTVKEIAAHVDVLPTLLEACGIAAPEGLAIDGKSLVPLLEGRREGWPERMLFVHREPPERPLAGDGSVRTSRHRLVVQGKAAELYDMIADPGQQRNVAAEQPEEAARLRAAYEEWLRDVARRPPERPPIAVGYDEMRTVELPAPEAYLRGGLRWKGSAGYANDWITGWTSTRDEAAWEVDVVRAARYEATLLYTCPEGDAGSRIRIEAGGKAVEAELARAHDPAPLPSPDRVPRGEVYEKEWGELPMGTLELPQGRTQLVVRALSKPGAAVLDLKAVRLRRL